MPGHAKILGVDDNARNLDILRCMRARPELAGTKIIMVSAKAMTLIEARRAA